MFTSVSQTNTNIRIRCTAVYGFVHGGHVVRFNQSYIQPHFVEEIKFDFASAYHHADTCEPHTQYLEFAWVSIIKKFIQFLHTKITIQLIQGCRGQDMQLIMYLDKGFCNNIDTSILKDRLHKTAVIWRLLVSLKSIWIPVQSLTLWGIYFDTIFGTLTMPQNHITNRYYNFFSDVYNRKSIHVKELARYFGQIMPMDIVLGNVTQLMILYINMKISNNSSWKDSVEVSNDSIQQLQC